MDNKMCGQKTTKIDVESVIEAQNSPNAGVLIACANVFIMGPISKIETYGDMSRKSFKE